jgi:hypothetical protein
MDRAVVAKAIRAKVALGFIQEVYRDRPMLLWGGVANLFICRACSAPFVSEVAVGYRADWGELHWFHTACDEVRKDS